MMASLLCHHAAITIHCSLHYICCCADFYLTYFKVVSHTGTLSTMRWNYQFRQWELLVPIIYAVVKHALYQSVMSIISRLYSVISFNVMAT